MIVLIIHLIGSLFVAMETTAQTPYETGSDQHAEHWKFDRPGRVEEASRPITKVIGPHVEPRQKVPKTGKEPRIISNLKKSTHTCPVQS